MKKCSKCKKTKEINQFYKDIIKKDGLGSWCKDCERNKRWRINNPDKAKIIRRRAYEKEKVSVSYRLNHRLRCGINKSLYLNSKNNRKWELIVGYTTLELKRHLEKRFLPGMTWDGFFAGEIHIDHKIPISAFNFEKPEDIDFKKCWALKNLQPLWQRDNIIKKAKITTPFQPSLVI